jgi:hypothetical protein
MHHDVRAAQLLGDRRVPDVEDVPLGVGALAAPLVDGDDLLDLLAGGSRSVSSAPTPAAAPVTATTGRARLGWLSGFALREPADLGNSPGVSSGCLQ